MDEDEVDVGIFRGMNEMKTKGIRRRFKLIVAVYPRRVGSGLQLEQRV